MFSMAEIRAIIARVLAESQPNDSPDEVLEKLLLEFRALV